MKAHETICSQIQAMGLLLALTEYYYENVFQEVVIADDVDPAVVYQQQTAGSQKAWDYIIEFSRKIESIKTSEFREECLKFTTDNPPIPGVKFDLVQWRNKPLEVVEEREAPRHVINAGPSYQAV